MNELAPCRERSATPRTAKQCVGSLGLILQTHDASQRVLGKGGRVTCAFVDFQNSFAKKFIPVFIELKNLPEK